MRAIWKEVAKRVTDRLVQTDRDRIMQALRARVTKHHPVLEIHIDDLEALIKGEQNGN
jgi:hypothetical protein